MDGRFGKENNVSGLDSGLVNVLLLDDRATRKRDLRASLEEDSRQQLLVRMADAPAKRPSTARDRTAYIATPRRRPSR